VRTVAERLAGKAAVVEINTQENQALASRFAVRGIPVVMLLKNGKVIDQISGAQPADALLGWFKRHQ